MALTLPSPSPPVLSPSSLPPLPAIHSRAIRTRVFTHRSLHARPNHVFEDHPDDPSPDNEQFEHLGDAVLGLVVTSLLLDMCPNLHVGPSTKIRALIVGNANLAAISCQYQLPARLSLHPAQAVTLRASPHVQADVFESYVGGLYRDQGLATVEKWLKALFRPYTTEAYVRVRTQHGLPPLPTPEASPVTPATSLSSTSSGSPSNSPTVLSTPSEVPGGSSDATSLPPRQRYPRVSGTPTTTGHLALFNQHLQKARREVEWIYDDRVPEASPTTPIWAVRVEVDGEVFGRGKGGTKKAARNEAAKEGLVRMGVIV